MANWFVGLTTRRSAERASKWGGIACLFDAARQMYFNVLNTIDLTGESTRHLIGRFVGGSILPVLFVVGGIRMWQRGGWILGSLLALMATADLAMAIIFNWIWIVAYTRLTLSAHSASVAQAEFFSIFILRVAITALIINGVRGALAVQKVDYSRNLRGVFT